MTHRQTDDFHVKFDTLPNELDGSEVKMNVFQNKTSFLHNKRDPLTSIRYRARSISGVCPLSVALHDTERYKPYLRPYLELLES